jgi:acyl dehydratase
LSGDFFFLHTDEELSMKTFYKTRIVPGLLTFAISEGLILRSGFFESIEEAQFVDIHDLRFTGAVVPGDTIRSKLEISGKKDSNRPGYGLITVRRTVLNQRGETVLTAETSHLKKMAKQEMF